MNDLHVDDQLAATIVDNQDSNTPSAIAKRSLNASEQATLVNDWQALLDISSLSHGHNLAIVTNVQDAVLLKDGAEHGLNDHRWGRVADEGGLFVQLTGEEVDTKVAVLAGLRRHGDADDLRGTALEKQNVADADEMALDGHAAAAEAWLNVADLLNIALTNAGRTTGFSCLGDVYLLPVTATMVMMMVSPGEGMQHAIGGSLHATAEAVVLALVVVVTHVSFDRFVDLDFFLFGCDLGFAWATTLVFDVVGGISASTVLSLGDV